MSIDTPDELYRPTTTPTVDELYRRLHRHMERHRIYTYHEEEHRRFTHDIYVDYYKRLESLQAVYGSKSEVRREVVSHDILIHQIQ